jgi:hypothetical protein
MSTTTRYSTYAMILAMISTFAIYPYDQDFMNHIINRNINSLTATDVPSSIAMDQDFGITDLINAIKKPRKLQLTQLTSRNKRSIMFTAIEQPLNEHDTIIDQFFADKMGIVHGEINPQDHLIKRLTTDLYGTVTLKTELGAKRFVELISQPTTAIEQLQKRQKIIHELVQNDELRLQCTRLLDAIAATEKFFFEFYRKQGIEKSEQSKLSAICSKSNTRTRYHYQ